MSKQLRICLVGATGLIGTEMIAQATSRPDLRIVGVARREIKLPPGARMEMLLAEPANWSDAIAASAAKVLVCVLGAAQAQRDGDEDAYRAVNQDLILACAKAAKALKIEHMIVLSAAGAHVAHKDFFLHVKGKMEDALAKVHFRRLDILRPMTVGAGGALRKMAGLFGASKQMPVQALVQAIFELAHENRGGRFIHEHDAIIKLAKHAKH